MDCKEYARREVDISRLPLRDKLVAPWCRSCSRNRRSVGVADEAGEQLAEPVGFGRVTVVLVKTNLLTWPSMVVALMVAQDGDGEPVECDHAHAVGARQQFVLADSPIPPAPAVSGPPVGTDSTIRSSGFNS